MDFGTYEIKSRESVPVAEDINTLARIAGEYHGARINPVGDCRIQLLCGTIIRDVILNKATDQGIKIVALD